MMRTRKLMGAAVLLAAGYVAGALTQPATLSAVSQDGSSNDVGQDVLKAYHAVSKSVKELNSLLSAGGQSSTVTSGVNFFSSSVAINAIMKSVVAGKPNDSAMLVMSTSLDPYPSRVN